MSNLLWMSVGLCRYVIKVVRLCKNVLCIIDWRELMAFWPSAILFLRYWPQASG